jgi:riboflavin kinase/FMN adenylyltransferase
MAHPLDIENLGSHRPEGGCVVTLGNFDGVHRGHQELLSLARARARALGVPLAVITFEPHTRHFLDAHGGPLLLTTWLEREALLCAHGADLALTLRFDDEVRRLSATAFVDQLAMRLGVREFVLGWDHRFGRGAEGTAEGLRPHLEACGIGLTVVDAHEIGGVVNSTRIREALTTEGGFAEAVELMGHPWTFHGEVVKGDQRGRTIGFPTANLDPVSPRKLLPADGVYAGWLDMPVHGRRPTVVNVGRAPTFLRDLRLVEAHVPGGPGPEYGDVCRLELTRFLRGSKAFESVQALIAQLHEDVRHALEFTGAGR